MSSCQQPLQLFRSIWAMRFKVLSEIQPATPGVGMKEGESGARTLQLQSHWPWPASQVHSSGLWWLWVQSCGVETSLAILWVLPLSWLWHPSCLLSSDVVSFLLLPLCGVTSAAGTAGSLSSFVTRSHPARGCVCADTVSMQPVFQGSCLLHFCGLKKSPQHPVRKQPCSEEF